MYFVTLALSNGQTKGPTLAQIVTKNTISSRKNKVRNPFKSSIRTSENRTLLCSSWNQLNSSLTFKKGKTDFSFSLKTVCNKMRGIG